RTQPVSDVTNSQPLAFRKNATFTGVFANKSIRRTGDTLQSTQSVRLMTGQFYQVTSEESEVEGAGPCAESRWAVCYLSAGKYMGKIRLTHMTNRYLLPWVGCF